METRTFRAMRVISFILLAFAALLIPLNLIMAAWPSNEQWLSNLIGAGTCTIAVASLLISMDAAGALRRPTSLEDS